MDAFTRWKLALAERILDFARDYPSTDQPYLTIVGRLKGCLDRAQALLVQEREGRGNEHAAVARRAEARRALREGLVHVVAVARSGIADHPDWTGVFIVPSTNMSHRAFITAAKSILATALAAKDALVTLGLDSAALDHLTEGIATFDASSQTTDTARSNHVGARAELTVLSRECGEFARILDGINRWRFRDDPEMLGAWISARKSAGSPRKQAADKPAA